MSAAPVEVTIGRGDGPTRSGKGIERTHQPAASHARREGQAMVADRIHSHRGAEQGHPVRLRHVGLTWWSHTTEIRLFAKRKGHRPRWWGRPNDEPGGTRALTPSTGLEIEDAN